MKFNNFLTMENSNNISLKNKIDNIKGKKNDINEASSEVKRIINITNLNKNNLLTLNENNIDGIERCNNN